jgi:hypothetical protein
MPRFRWGTHGCLKFFKQLISTLTRRRTKALELEDAHPGAFPHADTGGHLEVAM